MKLVTANREIQRERKKITTEEIEQASLAIDAVFGIANF